jgi:hypothetical protein
MSKSGNCGEVVAGHRDVLLKGHFINARTKSRSKSPLASESRGATKSLHDGHDNRTLVAWRD